MNDTLASKATLPVYEEDGSGAHVSWCPCRSCEAKRKGLCLLCGSRKPLGQSCICFDNGCE